MWAGVLGRQRAVLVLEGSANERVNPASGEAYAFTSDPQSPPAQEEEGTWLSLLVFDANPVCRCCRRQHLVCGSLCVRLCQCPACVCVSLAYELVFATG